MRLVLKLTLAIVAAMAVVLGGYGFFGLGRLSSDVQEEMRQEHVQLAAAVAEAFAFAWRRDGLEVADQLMTSVNEAIPNIEVHWVRQDGAPPRGEIHFDGEVITRVLEQRIDKRVMFSRVSLASEAGHLGEIQLTESMASADRILSASARSLLWATLGIVAASGLIAVVLGTRLVGTRVARLVARTQRIASGDFSPETVKEPDDELGYLARAVERMTADLDAATESRIRALEQLRHAERLVTVGKLAAGVAHELGTPLQIVHARARMISGAPEVNEDLHRYADTIADQCDRMSRIIRSLLDFGRTRRPERRRVRLLRLVESSVALLSPLAQRSGVSFVLGEGDEEVDVDVGQIQQALTNVLVNAVHASPRESTVNVDIVHAQGRVGIAVRDEGKGIAREHLSRVFEPFFTTKDVGEGTGLGLSVAHGIVHEHGGTIEVVSELGHGACFTLWLEAAQ